MNSPGTTAIALLITSVAFPAAAQQATATSAAQVTMPTDGTRPPAQGMRANATTLPPGPITFPPAVSPAPKPPALPATAKRAVKLAGTARNRPTMPRADADGYVRFAFGATQPTVVCAPSRICVVSLEPGEVITGGKDAKDLGNFTLSDTVNWSVTPTFSGSGKQLVTQLSIRPTQPNLQATLVVPTQRRLYSITLRSTRSSWMPLVAFDYPGDQPKRMAASYRQQIAAAMAAPPGGGSISDITFGFNVDGEAPWRPTAVITDGTRTVIAFPASVSSSALPVLVGLGNDDGWFSEPSQQVINSQILPGNRMLVDGVLSRAALVSGVGDDQIAVKITRSAE
ncbi:MAG: TrbG/VirB9 family P-type conjugative transfer protein [Rhodospirillales bacterium]|nr:TrbG/VirB9 family P-type conjugative transfer protein [Rhodospirillales bacterium]